MREGKRGVLFRDRWRGEVRGKTWEHRQLKNISVIRGVFHSQMCSNFPNLGAREALFHFCPNPTDSTKYFHTRQEATEILNICTRGDEPFLIAEAHVRV